MGSTLILFCWRESKNSSLNVGNNKTFKNNSPNLFILILSHKENVNTMYSGIVPKEYT